jgi:hypothetical protein
MKQSAFIREGLTINLLVADRVEDILPKLTEAAHAVAEAEKDMAPAVAERL